MNEKFEKKIDVQGYQPLDFKGDNGESIRMCKVTYMYTADGVNNFGIKSVTLNLPYEYKDKFVNVKFPCSCKVTFTCDDLTKRPSVEDLVVLARS